MSAAVMTPADVRAARAAALERREPRRNVYVTYTDAEELQARLEGRTLRRVSIYAPEFRPAESAAEWWDDRITEWGGLHRDPAAPPLVCLALALRDGGETAEALKAARQLEPRTQWTVYRNLQLWRKHDESARFGADRAVDRVLAEWTRLKLPTEDPEARPEATRRQRPWEITAAEATA